MTQNRQPHKLAGNKLSEWPSRFIFFDTETYRVSLQGSNAEQHLKLGWLNFYQHEGAYKRDLWHEFREIDEFWDFLEAMAVPKKRTLIIAHNIDFDLQVLDYQRELMLRKYDINKSIIDSNRFIVQARKNKHTYLFLDNSNYTNPEKVKLAILGQELGIEKIDTDPFKATDKDLSLYCRRDVEIVREYILTLFSYFKDNDFCHFAYTTAGLAFNTYRHRFMNTPVFIHTYPKAIALERAAYKGGRCEAFFIGQAPKDIYYYLDVNSMYPFMMLQKDFPFRHLFTYEHAHLFQLNYFLSRRAVIADVMVKLEEPAIAVKEARLLFPVGEFRTTLTSPELQYVKEHGEIKRCFSLSLYEAGPIFKDYVTHFYNWRLKHIEEGRIIQSKFDKVLLNSLYGKFGQRITVSVPVDLDFDIPVRYFTEYDLETKVKYNYVKIGDQWFREGRVAEGYHSMVAIPAFVTAYARMYLWQIMKTAGLENVFYCDTDSVFVNQAGYDRLTPLVSKEKVLGLLGLKMSSPYLDIRGAKMYKFGDKIRIKGIKGPESFLPQFKQWRFQRSRMALRKPDKPYVLEEHYSKELSYKYEKGDKGPDGRIKPFRLSSFLPHQA